ncbi:unnamed protein product [Candidula unifasciata]|uniref:Uncharacterized protein n=1 Tax=Candidula unifasciata TaxID=100452 RepID=A0A8S4A1J6_9EUPU|nr:unnamed protein product [Candidula unifasciata]
MTALPSAQALALPPPDLQLHLISDSDTDVDQCYRPGSRRPSNVSLSRKTNDPFSPQGFTMLTRLFFSSSNRIRSCPQLAVQKNNDSPCCDMAPITDNQGNIIHMCPALKTNLYVDVAEPDTGGIRSAASTPTPPSSPGSRRNYVVSSSCVSKFQTCPCETVLPSTTALGIQTNTYSVDSQKDRLDGWLPLGNENLQQHDTSYLRNSCSNSNFPVGDFSQQLLDDNNSEVEDGSSVHINGRFPSHGCYHYFQDTSLDDSIDKCNRWLQSLHINTADKVKSRSHIQLPTA